MSVLIQCSAWLCLSPCVLDNAVFILSRQQPPSCVSQRVCVCVCVCVCACVQKRPLFYPCAALLMVNSLSHSIAADDFEGNGSFNL